MSFLTGRWIIAWNESAGRWKTRVALLDPRTGGIRSLFERELEPKPNYPPPKWCVAGGGLAIGNFGEWAFYSAR